MHFNGKALDMKSTKMDSNKKPFYDCMCIWCFTESYLYFLASHGPPG